MHLIGEKIEEYVALEDVVEHTLWTPSIIFIGYKLGGEKSEDINNNSCNASTPNSTQRLEEK